jgi:hypothetical protein
VARQGARAEGDPGYAKPTGSPDTPAEQLAASFTVAELLRNGTTTFMEFGSHVQVQESLMQVERFGIELPRPRLRFRALGRREQGAAPAGAGRR